MTSSSPALWLFLSSVTYGAAAFFLTRLIEPAWDRITSSYIRDLQPMLTALNLDDGRIPQRMRWWGIAMAVAFLFVALGLGMWPVAFVVTYMIYAAPRIYLQALIAKRSFLLRDQLVSAVTGLANATRAGLSLAQGIDNVAQETPEPLAAELHRIVRDYHGGRPLAHALKSARERLQLDGFTLFASALLVSLERGGKITEALDRIGRSLQENQRLERKLQAETESGRKVVVILASFPFVFLGLFYFLNPEGTGLLFTTLVGQLVLLVVIAMVYFAVQWARRILALEV
ncbi:MAG: type II secretion system F family protein [Planctomycetia bacterium]|nr:type II secretion system F family protein [Planctomycetia bacterium]